MASKLDLIDSAELQRLLGISRPKLNAMRASRMIPYTKLVHRTIRYSLAAVKAALKGHTFQAINVDPPR